MKRQDELTRRIQDKRAKAAKRQVSRNGGGRSISGYEKRRG